MANDILYPDFLEDEAVYREAEQYWASFFDSLLAGSGYTFRPYLNNTAADGTVFNDGNPIFHAYVPELDRAVRIIQEEPEEPAEMGSWVSKTEIEGKEVEELVMSLVLTEETKAEAERVIREWLNVQEPLNTAV